MFIGNSFHSFSYNIQQGLKDNQPPANPAPTSSPLDGPPQGQDTQPKPKGSGMTSLGGGKLT
ncbi:MULTISPECIES: hypothetical protein [Pseudomonas]|uniref:Uncharacterized protein n=1 Tax=Pseudomonas synxantha TaxID=47883 RepID=A0A5D3GFT7_9PSED|nr:MULTISPECIES: hypothetical protein [Pseudomonas]MBY8970386.1 hypothetical protein [Pseudomonas sp. P867]MCK3828690.1 hypothetical protein [Pseudomonas sp. W2Aug9]MCK3833938.1 hypothetical protein [Pseudomonas fluorescens]MCK3854264.1 hypothetical protein [Pseudomonas sp. W2Jun17]TYK59303.1 hypothetical protein FXO26_06675 [Pseudomonas synxantha]